MTETNSLRAALRVHTNDVHQQLHLHPSFVALFDGSIDLEHYAALMQRFHGFYAALDAAVARAGMPSGTQFTYAKRGDLIESDLRDLGMTPSEIRSNPMCDALESVVTSASVGGALYVIEGATLGAAQIDRAAQKLLSTETTTGRSFWAWSRANGKARWSAVTQLLHDLDAQGCPHAPIITGANNTFQALADWLAPLERDVAPLEKTAS